ncbi:MAG: hypothetical protein ROW52_10350, partial [Anaerolineaceae bacterium]
ALPLCRPPLEYQPALIDIVHAGLVVFTGMLPERISLVELLEIVEGSGEMRGMHFADLYANYRALRGIIRVSPFLMMASILLIGLAANRRPWVMLTGWGVPLLIGGTVGMIIAVGLGLAGNLIAESFVRQLAVTRPAGMYQVLVAVVRGVSNQFTLYSSLNGLAVAVIGAGMFLFGRFSTGRREEAAIERDRDASYIQDYPAGLPQDDYHDDLLDYPVDYGVQYPTAHLDYEPRYPDEAPTIFPEEPLDLNATHEASEAPTIPPPGEDLEGST